MIPRTIKLKERPKEPEKRPTLEDILPQLQVMKGDKGDTGDKPKKGVDYFTPQDQQEFLKAVTPKKGIHYFDGQKGEKGDPGVSNIPGPKGERGPKGVEGKDGRHGIDGRNGRDGKDGRHATVDEVVKELREKQSLEPQDIKGLHQKLTDLRWHGGGLSKVAHDSTLTGNGTLSSPLSVVSTPPPPSGTTGTEIPLGAIDGVNVTFTTVNPPGFITVGGVTYFPGDGFTFTGSGPYTLTLSQAPFPNQTIHSVYFSQSVVTPAEIQMEVASGSVNGVNKSFTVLHTPDFMEVSGQIMVSSTVDPADYGFSIVATTVTFVNPPTQTPHSFYQINNNPTNLMMEIPSGTVNGVNTSFTVANQPVFVEVDGQTMVSSTDDATQYGYTYSAGTITFVNAPKDTPHSFHN